MWRNYKGILSLLSIMNIAVCCCTYSLTRTLIRSDGVAMTYAGASAESSGLGSWFARWDKHRTDESEGRSNADSRVCHLQFVVVAIVRASTSPAVLRWQDNDRWEDDAQELRVASGPVARSGQQCRQPVRLLLLQRQLPLSNPSVAAQSSGDKRHSGRRRRWMKTATAVVTAVTWRRQNIVICVRNSQSCAAEAIACSGTTTPRIRSIWIIDYTI